MEYKAEVLKLDHQGRGIVKLNNKIVFVDKSVPGEIINYKIKEEHKKFNIGEVISYDKEISNQQEYDCPYYKECGGCQISKLSYQQQLLYKKEKVNDILKKYCNLDIDLEIMGSDKKLQYRNKVIFHVKDNKIGFYEENTNKLIEIDKCLLVNDKVNNIISKIMIRNASKDIMDVFYGKVDNNQIISLLENDVTSLIIYDKVYKTIYGKDKIKEKLDNLSFYISSDSFFQVNTKQAENLYHKVLEYSNLDNNKRVLDLYCGTGTISIYLARYAQEVIGDAVENALKNNITNCKFINKSASDITFNNIDVIIVDPPRSGLDNKLKNTLLKSNVDRIIYISCNPITLARDLNVLKEKYDIIDITLFDMFPQSYHVENVCLLKHK